MARPRIPPDSRPKEDSYTLVPLLFPSQGNSDNGAHVDIGPTEERRSVRGGATEAEAGDSGVDGKKKHNSLNSERGYHGGVTFVWSTGRIG